MDQMEIEIDIMKATKSKQMVSLEKEELSNNAKTDFMKGGDLRYP